MEDHLKQDGEEPFNELPIDLWVTGYLRDTSKWTRFLAIVGFIGIGLLLAVAVFMAVITSSNDQFNLDITLSFLLFIGIAVLYFFPTYYLLHFSRYMKRAVSNQSQTDMETAFRYLKWHYKFIGIILIVMMVLYTLTSFLS